MQKSLETREGFAEMLQSLFDYAGVSNKSVAKMLDVNERTVRNWLDGASEPDPSTLVKMFRLLNVPMIPFIKDRNKFSSDGDDKHAVLSYVNSVASDSELHDLNYNLNCKHGSSISSQLALVSMLNHMKLEYRLMIAKMVMNLWEIANSNGGLQNVDEYMPDVEKVRSAIIKSHVALKNGQNSYTDI